ncbi:MAG: homoserine dehydrogenase [Myxococcales bacterium]|nr:homoserine dehydrogenase [Myxococcales bacterium]MDD9970585.1 homoserine dehydrogenase [Myxococcales bacterium]
MSKIRIGLIGCGVVGQGIMRLLHEHADSIEARLGSPIEVRRIVARNPTRDRGPYVDRKWVTVDADAVLADPDIDIIVEVMGGIDPADGYIRRAMEHGKSVVTANKALIADRGHELFELAATRGVDLYFEAAVAGGVPVIRVLREALTSDRVVALKGIINGTSNYILSRMEEQAGLSFADALAEAQSRGYAEADPTLDVGGGDACHKLAILATLAFGKKVGIEQVATEGIERVSAVDMAFAKRFGFTVKPLAIGRALDDGRLDLRVHPALIGSRQVLASIGGALNAIYIDGAAVGPSMLSGLGAGALPTAVSVVSDIVDVGRNLRSEARGRVQHTARGAEPALVQDLSDHECRFFLRFSVRDESGVLGRLAGLLGDEHVSIEQMVQEGQGDRPTAVVMLTHPAGEGGVRRAVERIDALPEVVEPTHVLRIEEDRP